ncbi:unnamed protein product [Peniophora sp. CBMAI 1063]|nr:unnamed protein product [Peniophora sp. CBMAI 1063]
MTDASPPALSLPEDVFLYLAALFRPNPSESQAEHEMDDYRLEAWASLPAVCRQWREICLGSPSYWSYFVLPNKHVHPRRMLARVRDALLDVRIELSEDATDQDEAQVAADLSLLNDRTQNIRSFSLHSRMGLSVLTLLECTMQILSLPHTRLEHLYFHDGHPLAEERVISAARAVVLQSPSLRTFMLKGHQRLDWSPTTSNLRQLTHLHLDFLDFAHMRGALTYLPQLQTAFVNLGEGQLAQGVDFVPSARSLSWPALMELTFQCHPIDAPAFWNALDVPHSVQVTFIIVTQSPFVAAMESRRLLSTALSMFLPSRHGETPSQKLNALGVSYRKLVDERSLSRVALEWYREASEDLVSRSHQGNGGARRTLGKYATSLWIEPAALKVVLGYIPSSFNHLGSLHLDSQNLSRNIIAAMSAYFPHMSTLQELHICGSRDVHIVGRSLSVNLPGLRRLIVERFEGSEEYIDVVGALCVYLGQRSAAGLPTLEYLRLREDGMTEGTLIGFEGLVQELCAYRMEDV